MQNFCTVLTTCPVICAQLPWDTTIERRKRSIPLTECSVSCIVMISQSGALQCKISAQRSPSVLLCVLRCFVTQQYKGVKWSSPSVNALWIVPLWFPNQVHFNAKFLHSVYHVSCYVCSATLGHNYPKTKEEALVWINSCVVASAKRAAASILGTILLAVAKLACDPESAT